MLVADFVALSPRVWLVVSPVLPRRCPSRCPERSWRWAAAGPSVAASPRPRPCRCVSLQIKAVEGQLDRDPQENLALTLEIDRRLLEVEEKFASIGHKEKCMDIQLERARIKRWGPAVLPAPGKPTDAAPHPAPGTRASLRVSLGRGHAHLFTLSHTRVAAEARGCPPPAAPSPPLAAPIVCPSPQSLPRATPPWGPRRGSKHSHNQRLGAASSLYEGKGMHHLGACAAGSCGPRSRWGPRRAWAHSDTAGK